MRRWHRDRTEQVAEQMQRRWKHQPRLGSGQAREIRRDLAGPRRFLECRGAARASAPATGRARRSDA